MKKIHLKIMSMILVCLITLGAAMGIFSVLALKQLGDENINTLDTKLREDFDRLAKSQVESALTIIENAYVRKDVIGEAAAKEEAREYIRAMRYGESGYIFVYDSNGETIAMMGNDLEGTNRWDLQDAYGTYIIRDLVKAAKDGTGFTTYYYPKPGETEASPKRSYNQYFASWDWIVGTGNYIDDIDALINREQIILDKRIFNTVLFIVGLDIFVVLLSLILSWFMGKRISRPVEYLAGEARKIAEGDLTVELQVLSHDETGDLAEAFSDMIERLKFIVKGIVEAAQLIKQNANEVASASQQVASGASEQASSAEEISASMEELSSNIQMNTDNSRQSNTIVSQAARDAGVGGQAVEETVDSMKTISEKIGIIEEIARNTNLLALNAAIEAARAGDAGKGFAVVASEVRKLAENSQIAANDITQISGKSVRKADETRELMRNMVPAIQKSAEIAEEIMEGSNEQAKGAEQINMALLQMDQVIQANASSSEQIAAMSEELKNKSDELDDLVSFFHIGERPAPQKKVVKPVRTLEDHSRPSPVRVKTPPVGTGRKGSGPALTSGDVLEPSYHSDEDDEEFTEF